MSFAEDLQDMDATILNEFGVVVTYMPAMSAQYPLTAILDKGEDRAYCLLWAPSTSFEHGEPEKGDTVYIDAEVRAAVPAGAYSVVEIQYDRDGCVTMKCRKGA